jgi:hypothetical protein
MSRGRAAAETDYTKYPQFNYYPYGFGEFDEDPEVHQVERIRYLVDQRYTPKKISVMLNLPEYHVGILIKKYEIKWKDSK